MDNFLETVLELLANFFMNASWHPCFVKTLAQYVIPKS